MKKRASVFVCFLLVAMLVSCGTAAATNASNPTGTIGMEPLSFTAVDNSMFDTSDIYCVAYGDGKFIAGGDGGKISYSTDGINWNTVNDSKFDGGSIFDICYGDGKFVAVGESGKIAYSPDGITWTLVAESPFVEIEPGFGSFMTSIETVIYGNGKYIAGGGANFSIIAHSADGITWVRPDGVQTFPFTAVGYDGTGNYLAISKNGMGAETIVASSPDALTWTDKVNGRYSERAGIAYGSGRFVYVFNNIIAYSTDGASAHSLANGFTWRNNPPNSVFGQSAITCVTYGRGMFVAGGNDGKMAHSVNGETWNIIENSAFGTTQINGIAFGDGKFVAVGNGGKIAYSR